MRLLLILLLLFTSCQTTKKEEKQEPPVKETVEKKKGGKSYLGIIYEPSYRALRIVGVYPDSPAYRAGLVNDDLIIEAEGMPIYGIMTFRENILNKEPGTEVEFKVMKKNGNIKIVKVILEEVPDHLLEFKK